MNDSKDFQDAESVRSGNSHVTSRPVSFPPHPIPEGMFEASYRRAVMHLGFTWFFGKRSCRSHASSSAPYPQEMHQWNSSIEESLHTSTVEKSEKSEQNQDLRGPSAKDSVIFSGGDSSKNCGADQQRLQILDFHFDKFPTPPTFACWKTRYGVYLFTIPYGSDAMDRKVELVDAVDELRSSSSTRGISMPNFEVLDARIASALNKIIHNSQFKRRISLDKGSMQKTQGRSRTSSCKFW